MSAPTTTAVPDGTPGTTAREVLRLDDVHVFYGDTEIVRGVDLAVRAGEKVGLVGESGSGKSTLALAILGLLAKGGSVRQGSIAVLGRDTVHLSERQHDEIRGKDLSLVFQDPLTSLDPVKTIGSQIAEVLKRHNRSMSKAQLRARSVELLSLVGVPDPAAKLRQYPHEFSGGMRQRVLIAIAIANDPAVLIADEPTTALDVTTQAQVLEVLDNLVKVLGIAVVLITHDLGVIAGFCDRVCVMYAGRVVEQSPVDELFARPGHPYSKALLTALPLPGRSRDEPLEWIPGAPPSMTALPTGCSFAPRCKFAEEICVTRAPQQVPLSDPVNGQPADHWAECHFAVEVQGRAAPAHRVESGEDE